ncbi:MAG: FtsW/RodA/SpoVE family cell cycle protein [Chloroflexi bacterium]|nr:FtsW/RodA/SpoVE family cell cycle protein [Chloroflexota bacterium]
MGLRAWRHFDYVLLVVTILLVLYGVLMIYSANLGSLDPDLQELWRRQAMVGSVGVGLIFLLAIFPRDYEWLGDFWWLAYLLAVVLLVFVYFFGGSEIGDVSIWIDLGVFQFQPSFLAMNLLTISMGAILSRRRRKRRSSPLLFGAPKTSLLAEEPAERPDLVNYLASAFMTFVLVAFVFLQPDMATAAVLVFIWLAMLFESDISMGHLVFTGLLGVGALIPLWDLMARFPYMRDRVWGFIDPGSDPDVAYQLNQAAIAIGSGGLWGKNFAQGTQSQLRYLPVRHTDFIFSVVAEELGFAGVMLLFILYLILFYRLLRIILMAPDTYGRLLVTGTLAMILFQLCINIGMNLGMLPVAGLPLPFISYGNSALLTTMIGIGIAENVAMRYRKLEFKGG